MLLCACGALGEKHFTPMQCPGHPPIKCPCQQPLVSRVSDRNAPRNPIFIVYMSVPISSPVTVATRRSALLLAGAGLSASLLSWALSAAIATAAADTDPFLGFLPTGVAFGVVLSLYFAFYEGRNKIANIFAFTFVCALSYPAAVFLTGFLELKVLPADASLVSPHPHLPMLLAFIGGCVGSSLILTAGLSFFGSHGLRTESGLALSITTLAGGMLGVVGAATDNIINGSEGSRMTALFLIWQTGVALTLGLLLTWDGKQTN